MTQRIRTTVTVGTLVLGVFALSACQTSQDPAPTAAKKSSKGDSRVWKPVGKILDQGSVGACTGFAVAGVLGKGSKDAMKIYTLATKLDHVLGSYPQKDTGSTLPAAATAAKKLGLISSFTNIRTSSGALKAVKTQRVLVTLRNYPDFGAAHAMILLGQRGDVLVFQSSWGTGFGKNGVTQIPMDEFKSNFVEAVTIKK